MQAVYFRDGEGSSAGPGTELPANGFQCQGSGSGGSHDRRDHARTWASIAALDDSPAGGVLAKLASGPRYLHGRLQQAMTALLADDLPPVDPQSALLSHALDDALAWHTHQDRHCAQCDELCAQCNADYDQASRYHELARALGVVGDIPCTAPGDGDHAAAGA
jgi:hypothetical protein